MTLTIALILFAWYLTMWRLSRAVAQSMETAVLATHQMIVLDRRPKRGQLTNRQKSIALAEAACLVECLLGTWRIFLIRVSLGTWDVTDWLHAQLESTLWRLKHGRVLPSSAQTQAPWMDGVIERVFAAVMKLYNLGTLANLRQKSAPCSSPTTSPSDEAAALERLSDLFGDIPHPFSECTTTEEPSPDAESELDTLDPITR